MFDRSARSEFLKVPPVPLARPVNTSVRRLQLQRDKLRMMQMKRQYRKALSGGILLLLLITFSGSSALCQQPGVPSGVPCCGPNHSTTSLRERAVKIVYPIYPDEARRKGIRGQVVVEVMIDEEGSVVSTRALYGQKLLREAATEAAKQCKFIPFELEGKRVKYIGSIRFFFPSKKDSEKKKEVSHEPNRV